MLNQASQKIAEWINRHRVDDLGDVIKMRGALEFELRNAQTGEIMAAYPCIMCARMIMNAGVREVVIRSPDGVLRYDPDEWRTSDQFWLDPAVLRQGAGSRE